MIGESMTQRRSRAVVALVAAVAAVATGCTGVVAYTAVPQLSGVRTAAGGRQLVVTYFGGGCDTAPKTRVIETTALVTVTVDIGMTGANCADVAYPRVLTFDLPQAFGQRRFRNGLRGPKVTVFDGSMLRSPTWLPAGYREITRFQSAAAHGSWRRSWRGAAAYTDPDLTLTIGPHPLRPPLGSPVPGRYRVGPATATLTRDTDLDQDQLSLQWTAPGTHTFRELSTSQLNTKQPMLTIPTLLRIANSIPS